jgi:hypothetical protein
MLSGVEWYWEGDGGWASPLGSRYSEGVLYLMCYI